MAFSLDQIFTTRTALPKNSGVVEISPITELRPYVRCFWVCERDKYDIASRVIPDCCADIIIDVENNRADFVGMCLDSFTATHVNAIFGIRFFAWAVPQFAQTNAIELFNAVINPQNIFYKFDEFKCAIIAAKSTVERVELANNYLISLLDSRCDSDIMNSLYDIIRNNGNISVSSLSRGIAVSKRTLERKFIQSIGATPKTVTELIRYQLLWQDCICNRFCALDSVEKFGYYDQAHMYNDFKKYHGIGLSEARQEYCNLSHFYNTVI